MRNILFLFVLLFSVQSFASSNPATSAELNSGFAATVTTPSLPVTSVDFAKMKMSEIEKLAGRKLKLKEKIAIKILQAKASKVNKGKDKGNYSKRSKTAFLLSILSLITIVFIPVSVILAVISIILAAKSLKANDEDRKARTAMGLSILALGIIVVGLMIWGIFISDGVFKLFIIN